MRALRVSAAALAAAGILGLGAGARGAPCGRPDLVDMVPPDGAADVPTNASLVAHYQPSAEYAGEDVILVRPDGEEQVLTAAFDDTEGQLRVTPTEPLQAGAAYTIRWPALRGLNAADPGRGGEAHFTAGTLADSQAPSFAGVSGVRWDLERRKSDCTDALEERYLFDVELGPASDDGGRAGLTLLLFQSAGPRVDGGSVPTPARALPAEGATARVALPVGDGAGRVCFAALVRDTTGQVSSSGAQEACVETTAPPFFRGCNVAGAGGGGSFWLLAFLLIAVRACRGR